MRERERQTERQKERERQTVSKSCIFALFIISDKKQLFTGVGIFLSLLKWSYLPRPVLDLFHDSSKSVLVFQLAQIYLRYLQLTTKKLLKVVKLCQNILNQFNSASFTGT